jgi:hypothetical protein
VCGRKYKCSSKVSVPAFRIHILQSKVMFNCWITVITLYYTHLCTWWSVITFSLQRAKSNGDWAILNIEVSIKTSWFKLSDSHKTKTASQTKFLSHLNIIFICIALFIKCPVVGLTTLPTSCADCLKIWDPQPPGTLRACPGL